MKHVTADIRRSGKFRIELTPFGWMVLFCVALFTSGFATGVFWAAK